MCVCGGTIDILSPLGEQEPAGNAGHRPAHVVPGLTLAMNPAGGQGRKRERKKRSEREKGRDGG